MRSGFAGKDCELLWSTGAWSVGISARLKLKLKWNFFTISNTDTKVRVRARLLVDGRNSLEIIDYSRVVIYLALLLLNGY